MACYVCVCDPVEKNSRGKMGFNRCTKIELALASFAVAKTQPVAENGSGSLAER